MEKCPDCGANMNGNKCEYCGYTAPQAVPQNPQSDLYGGIMGLVNQELQMLTKGGVMPQTGANPAYMSDFLKRQESFANMSEKDKFAVREKNRLARVALSNGKCPVCGTPFPMFMGVPAGKVCRNCGAILSQRYYMDRFF